jgi:hypothetical protein
MALRVCLRCAHRAIRGVKLFLDVCACDGIVDAFASVPCLLSDEYDTSVEIGRDQFRKDISTICRLFGYCERSECDGCLSFGEVAMVAFLKHSTVNCDDMGKTLMLCAFYYDYYWHRLQFIEFMYLRALDGVLINYEQSAWLESVRSIYR